MQSFSLFKKSAYSWAVFFGTILVLSAGYATYSALTPVDVGMPLTKEIWNQMILNLEDHEGRISGISGNLTSLSSTVSGISSTVSSLSISVSALPVVPSGAVMAFDLTGCPAGWAEYTQAYGRVVRGIDKSGSSIDPDGVRAKGATQADTLQDHNHYITGESWGNDNVVAFQDTNTTTTYAAGGNAPRWDSYIYVGSIKSGRVSTETRMKNVALLYCRKN